MVDCIELLQVITHELQNKEKTIHDSNDKITYLQNQVDVLNNTLREKDSHIAELLSRIDDMTSKTNKLVDELKEAKRGQTEFTKVSQIVSMERENNALKSEIAVLKTRINRLSSDTVTKNVSQMSESMENVISDTAHPTKKELEDETDNASEEFYEKKIKGITYFISNDVIYENLNGEEVGKRLGVLTKVEGRTKVMWD